MQMILLLVFISIVFFFISIGTFERIGNAFIRFIINPLKDIFK